MASVASADLQAAADEDQALDARELLEAELDADREQQQHHAHLGGGVDQRPVAHQAERVRADQHAGDRKPTIGTSPSR